MVNSVQDHYAVGAAADIVARILAALPAAQADQPALVAEQLFPFDQFHGRELLATREHAARLAPAPGAHLLDIGSGIGGPARYFASAYGCRVTGIDLTAKFVAAATELTRLCGLSSLVDFKVADAVALPLADASFDAAYCLYVGMNLPDKATALAECLRVLRPGGRLLWTEVVSGTDAPHYPLPWATTPEGSHLQTRTELAAALTAAGFVQAVLEDETAAHVELAQKMRQSGRVPSEAHRQANAVVLGADFVERRQNYIKSLAEGTIVSLLVTAQKPA